MGFPNFGGTNDGTYVPIACLSQQVHEYIICKGYYLIILPALVVRKGRFMKTNMRCTSREHNAKVLGVIWHLPVWTRDLIPYK